MKTSINGHFPWQTVSILDNTGHFPTDLCPFSLGKDALRQVALGPNRRSMSSISFLGGHIQMFSSSRYLSYIYIWLVVLTILKHLNKLIGTVFFPIYGWSESPRKSKNVYWLVVYLLLWKIWKSVGMIIPNILWKNKQCLKPPTR